MEHLVTAALTATIVTALILAANRFGERVGGLLSALPFTSVPALVSVGHERGLLAAEAAGVGGVLGCAMAALFALSYHAAARRVSPSATIGITVALLAAGLAGLLRLPASLPFAVALTCLFSAGAMLYIRHEEERRPAASTRSWGMQTAVAGGLTSAAVMTLAGVMDASLVGIVAAMPTIGIATVASCHATRGPGAVPRCLRAYVAGSLTKAIFCATFALCVCAHGMAVALLIAGSLGALGCAGTVVVGRLAKKSVVETIATQMRDHMHRRPRSIAPARRSVAWAQVAQLYVRADAGTSVAQRTAHSLCDRCGADESKLACGV